MGLYSVKDKERMAELYLNNTPISFIAKTFGASPRYIKLWAKIYSD